MTKRKLIRRSNLYIPKSYSAHTYNRFIKQFIDEFNWGLLTKDKIKRLAFTTSYINKCWAMQHPYYSDWIKLKLHRHIIPHLMGAETYFYTSNPFSNVAMFTIDLDANESSTKEDMVKAAEYITKNFHENAYYETSTSGEGIHIYIFVDISRFDLSYEDRDVINDYLNKDDKGRGIVSYSSLLSKIVKLEGFNCKVDKIKGTFSSYVFDQKVGALQIKKRGNLCKLPRPKDEDGFFKLVHTPIQHLTDIEENSDIIKNLLIDKFNLRLGDEFFPLSSDRLTPPYIPSSITSNVLYMNNQETGENAGLDEMESRNAVKRTISSIQRLARYLKRLPSYEEWHAFYVAHDLNTGSETPARRERFDNCLEFVGKTFDPEKCGLPYKAGEYLDDIKKLISVEELQELCAKSKTKITHADLDVAMGYHWLCTISNTKKGLELTVPTVGMIGLFRSLKKKGLHNRSCDRTKLVLLRKALQKIDYIICIDDSWATGVSKKWSIGENCPKYKDFVTFGFLADVERIRKQIRASKHETATIRVKTK